MYCLDIVGWVGWGSARSPKLRCEQNLKLLGEDPSLPLPASCNPRSSLFLNSSFISYFYLLHLTFMQQRMTTLHLHWCVQVHLIYVLLSSQQQSITQEVLCHLITKNHFPSGPSNLSILRLYQKYCQCSHFKQHSAFDNVGFPQDKRNFLCNPPFLFLSSHQNHL